MRNEVILALNEAGFNILEIYQPQNKENSLNYFVIQSIVFPQNNIFEYSLNGKDITEIIKSNSLQVQQIDYRNKSIQLLTKINELPNVNKKFSKDYSFIYHLA